MKTALLFLNGEPPKNFIVKIVIIIHVKKAVMIIMFYQQNTKKPSKSAKWKQMETKLCSNYARKFIRAKFVKKNLNIVLDYGNIKLNVV